MSETITRTKRSKSPSRKAFTQTAWTDCSLAATALNDPAALTTLGIRRAVLDHLPTRPVSLSPEIDQGLVSTRFVIEAPDLTALCGAYGHDDYLRDLHDQGVRGVRFDIAGDSDSAARQLRQALRYADHVAPLDWHIQLTFGAKPLSIAAHEWTLTQFPVAICLDGITGSLQEGAPDDRERGFVMELLGMGRTWIKLSGSADATAPFVQAVLATRPDRVVWGSGADAAAETDKNSHAARVAAQLTALKRSIPNERQRMAVLIANPERLYGF